MSADPAGPLADKLAPKVYIKCSSFFLMRSLTPELSKEDVQPSDPPQNSTASTPTEPLQDLWNTTGTFQNTSEPAPT